MTYPRRIKNAADANSKKWAFPFNPEAWIRR